MPWDGVQRSSRLQQIAAPALVLLLLRCMNTDVFLSCGWMLQIGSK